MDANGKKWRVWVTTGTDASGRRIRRSEVVYGGKREALQREHELKAKYGRVQRGPGGRGDTVAGYLWQWLPRWKGNRIRQRTMEGYETLVRSYIEPFIGDVQLARLGRDDIKDAYNRLTELGYAPSTVRATHNLLRAALDDAVESGRIGANPAASRNLVPVAEKPKRTIPTLK